MLANHKERDTRTTMKGQNRSAALGRPAMELLGGGGGGGGGGAGGAELQLVCGRPTLPWFLRHLVVRFAWKIPLINS